MQIQHVLFTKGFCVKKGKIIESDAVPAHLQSYNYESPKKKETKLQRESREHKEKENKKVKKSEGATARRKKENSKMKTLTFPGYRK